MKRRPTITISGPVMVLLLVGAACGGGDSTDDLHDLQVVGIDYELDSVLITNNGGSDVRTEGLWMYQDGEAAEFDIFTVESRSTVRFSLRDVGGADQGGGEVALFAGDAFGDPEAIVDYVAWGSVRHSKDGLATDARLWATDDTVQTGPTAVLILRTAPTGVGSAVWEEAAP